MKGKTEIQLGSQVIIKGIASAIKKERNYSG